MTITVSRQPIAMGTPCIEDVPLKFWRCQRLQPAAEGPAASKVHPLTFTLQRRPVKS
jgi:hypothetical protein